MPRKSDPRIAEYIATVLVEDPSISYPEVVRMLKESLDLKVSIQGAKNIALRECPKLAPKWKKTNPLLREYRCQMKVNGRKHMKKFKGTTAYSGDSAVYCPEHRSGKSAA